MYDLKFDDNVYPRCISVYVCVCCVFVLILL